MYICAVDRAPCPLPDFFLEKAKQGGQLETSDSYPAVPHARKAGRIGLALASVKSKQARATKTQEQPEAVLVLVPSRDLQELQWLLDG